MHLTPPIGSATFKTYIQSNYLTAYRGLNVKLKCQMPQEMTPQLLSVIKNQLTIKTLSIFQLKLILQLL